jgi:hypothetical protein
MNMTRTMVLIITIIGLICVVIKFWLEANWQNYKNPMAFFKILVKKQVELGLVDAEDLTENFHIRDSPFFSMLKNGKFWVEVIIMAIIPLPTKADSWCNNAIVSIETTNFIDPNGGNGQYCNDDSNDLCGPGGSGINSTYYYASDFIMALMFLKLYFLAQALVMLSPVNEKLYGKRVCSDYNFNPTFTFQLKAVMRENAVTTFAVMALILIVTSAEMLRIFERPYYVFQQGDYVLQEFNTFYSAFWVVIITMSSVGYGNLIATTWYGRFSTMIIIIIGAFLLSLLVAIITDWFILEDRKVDAINKMESD